MLKKLLCGAAVLMFANNVLADDCAITVKSNDAMQFDTSNIIIPASCSEFTVTLEHTGQLPKQAMGHNWVMTTKANSQAVASDGMGAGLDNNYLKPNDRRIIGATQIIGGGEQASTTFSVKGLDKSEEYIFFCSFPGHIGIMKGTVTLSD
ncbi:azurin [Alteromonas sp. D210916BOD_24]|uniref:azurin n=1 Tax=Alteromonas sp. D210916BOD_24 TaxID=3157618 RepID=UPI00399D2D6D